MSYSLFSAPNNTPKTAISPHSMEAQGRTSEKKSFENLTSNFGDFVFSSDWKDDGVHDNETPFELLDNAGAVFRQSPFAGPDLWWSNSPASYATTHEHEFSLYSKPISKSVSTSSLSQVTLASSPSEPTPAVLQPKIKCRGNVETQPQNIQKNHNVAPIKKRAQRSTSDPNLLNGPKQTVQKNLSPVKQEPVPKEQQNPPKPRKSSGFLRVFRPKVKPQETIMEVTTSSEDPVIQKEEITLPQPMTTTPPTMDPVPIPIQVPVTTNEPEAADTREAIPTNPEVDNQQLAIAPEEKTTWIEPPQTEVAPVLNEEPPKASNVWKDRWNRLPPSLWGYLALFSVIYILASPVHIIFHDHWNFSSVELFGWCIFFIGIYLLLIWIQLKFVLSVLPQSTTNLFPPPKFSKRSLRSQPLC